MPRRKGQRPRSSCQAVIYCRHHFLVRLKVPVSFQNKNTSFRNINININIGRYIILWMWLYSIIGSGMVSHGYPREVFDLCLDETHDLLSVYLVIALTLFKTAILVEKGMSAYKCDLSFCCWTKFIKWFWWKHRYSEKFHAHPNQGKGSWKWPKKFFESGREASFTGGLPVPASFGWTQGRQEGHLQIQKVIVCREQWKLPMRH